MENSQLIAVLTMYNICSRVPICHVTSCSLEDMTSVLGGRAVTRGDGGLLFYQCSAPGAEMSGSPSLVCTQRGWNDTKPECQCKL